MREMAFWEYIAPIMSVMIWRIKQVMHFEMKSDYNGLPYES